MHEIRKNKFNTDHVELFYNQDINRFIDTDGEIVNDLHSILEPWQINHAKEVSKKSCYVLIETKEGMLVELFFPYSFEDSEVFWEIYDN